MTSHFGTLLLETAIMHANTAVHLQKTQNKKIKGKTAK